MRRLFWAIQSVVFVLLIFSLRTNLSQSSPSHLAAAPPDIQMQHQFPDYPALPDLDKLVSGINAERSKLGLQKLLVDDRLNSVALLRAEDMSARTYYAHRSPDGTIFSDLLRSSNIDFGFACENLDLEFSKDESKFVNSWLNSTSGHRECLLSSSENIGLATATINTAGEPSYIVVTIITN